MRSLILAFSIFLQAVVAVPVLAQQGGACPNTCPKGEVRSLETGKCEPYKPLMV